MSWIKISYLTLLCCAPATDGVTRARGRALKDRTGFPSNVDLSGGIIPLTSVFAAQVRGGL